MFAWFSDRVAEVGQRPPTGRGCFLEINTNIIIILLCCCLEMCAKAIRDVRVSGGC